MKYPRFLTTDSTICLVTPSFSCSILPYSKRLEAAIKYYKNNNYKIKEGKYTKSPFSSDIKEFKNKAQEINDFFKDNNNNILLSVGGGVFMYLLLPYFDFEMFKENPKWFMGYSDNTNLTFLLPTLCDVASIYGPNFPEFGLENMDDSLTDSIKLLKGEKLITTNYLKFEPGNIKKDNPLASYQLIENTKIINYPNKNLEFSGRLIGGCLDTLLLFLGTKYDNIKNFIEKYKDDKIIWFMEACDLDLSAIYRALLQLKYAGWFENASGFIFGRPLMAYDEVFFDLNRHTVITKVLEDLNIPIIMDANIGHVKPTTPLICGSYAKVKSIDENLTIEMILK